MHATHGRTVGPSRPVQGLLLPNGKVIMTHTFPIHYVPPSRPSPPSPSPPPLPQRVQPTPSSVSEELARRGRSRLEIGPPPRAKRLGRSDAIAGRLQRKHALHVPIQYTLTYGYGMAAHTHTHAGHGSCERAMTRTSQPACATYPLLRRLLVTGHDSSEGKRVVTGTGGKLAFEGLSSAICPFPSLSLTLDTIRPCCPPPPPSSLPPLNTLNYTSGRSSSRNEPDQMQMQM